MRVLVVSGNQLLGQSLASMLQSLPLTPPAQASFCQPATEARSTTLYMQGWKADVVLVEAITDLSIGIATVKMLTSILPTTRVMLLGADDDEVSVYEAITAGADGYLPRTTSPAILAATLQGVMRGELGLSRTAASRLVRQMRYAVGSRPRLIPGELLARLTQRQREVFDLVQRGMRNREIADHLGISETTVCKHLSNILTKLHVHSRTQAIAAVAPTAAIIPLYGQRGESGLTRHVLEAKEGTILAGEESGAY